MCSKVPRDLCSIKVRIGTFQTGPRRKPISESKIQSSPISDLKQIILSPNTGNPLNLETLFSLAITQYVQNF